MRSGRRPGYVYRHFDENNVLLYIGSAFKPEQRTIHHKIYAPWGCRIDRVEVERFENIDRARGAEHVAIQTEYPRWNIKDRALDHPDGPAFVRNEIAAMFPGEWADTPTFNYGQILALADDPEAESRLDEILKSFATIRDGGEAS